MARKIFISFLGTNKYVETRYELEGKCSSPVVFIQEALTDELCMNWTDNDRIVIFYTEASKQKNWDDGGNFDKGLCSVLSNKQYGTIVKGKMIPEGFSESEIWDIFNIVYDTLEEDDCIYFDVTHAFRSIPMFSTILFNFSRIMKQTVVKKVYYGAFEKLEPSYIVKDIPLEQRIAPVIDLSNMIRLQGYNEMASSFISFGRIGQISKALIGSGKESQLVKQLAKNIELLDSYIQTNRMIKIEDGKVIGTIRSSLKGTKKIALNEPTRKILTLLEKEIDSFDSFKSSKNIRAAVEWAMKYKMFPQAYTLGQEYIISRVAEQLNNERDNVKINGKKTSEKDFRLFVSSLIQIPEEDLQNRNFRNELIGNEELVLRLSELEMVKQLKKPFAEFSIYRNSINHAKGEKTYKDFQEKFTLYYQCLEIINNNADQPK